MSENLAKVVELHPQGDEGWISKQAIAKYYGRSTRWVDLQCEKYGMPYRQKTYPNGRKGHRLFKTSETDAWYSMGVAA